jgi:hypothetical protein
MFDPNLSRKRNPSATCQAILKGSWTGTEVDEFDSAGVVIEMERIRSKLAVYCFQPMMEEHKTLTSADRKVEEGGERKLVLRAKKAAINVTRSFTKLCGTKPRWTKIQKVFQVISSWRFEY